MAKQSDGAIVVQAVLAGAFFFGLLTVAATWLDGVAGASFPRLAGQLRGGLTLFLLWLVVTSTLRSIHKLRRGVDGAALLLAGVGVALAGALFGAAFHWLAGRLSGDFAGFSAAPRALLFYGALSLLVALISLINLRVRNKMLGDVLELLVIGALVVAFFYFMK